MPKERSFDRVREVAATKRIEYARPELITQVVGLYAEGLGGVRIARQLAISSNSVFRILERAGVKRDPNARSDHQPKLSKDQQATVVSLYTGGALLADLAAQFQCSIRLIRKMLSQANVAPRPIGNKRGVTAEELEEIISWDTQGLSHSAIARKKGWSQPFISRLLKGLGRAKRKASGDHHGWWKGGKVLAGNGYCAVMVAADDPLASMRGTSGYVLEHRLVLARSLGRPLLKTETVHHINGDKTDNRLENLQLRQEKHGKHVVYQCLDCGSHNVRNVGLS